MRRLLVPALALLLPAPAGAFKLYDDPETGRSFEVSGYLQPFYRWVADDDDGEVPDGFGLARVRFGFSGRPFERTRFKFEARVDSQVALLDAYGTFDLAEPLQLTVGRFKVSFSRQELVSSSRLQLVSRAPFVADVPSRQLGVELGYASDLWTGTLPADFLRLNAGVFNSRSTGQAPGGDAEFLVAGRLELNPFGAVPMMEGDLRSAEKRAKLLVSLAANVTWEENAETVDDADQGFTRLRLGGDLTAAWHGAFLYAETYHYSSDFDDLPDRTGFGWSVQGGFFVPAPYLREHLELAGRVASWDPAEADDAADDAAFLAGAPGAGPGRAGEQAHREYVAGVNWYFHGHDLKLQTAYTHRQATEEWAESAGDGDAPRDVADDSFFVQATLRY